MLFFFRSLPLVVRFSIRWFGNFLLLFPVHSFRRFVILVFFRTRYPKSTYIGRGCSFLSRGRVRFGSNSYFNNKIRFDNRGTLFFGDNVIVSEGCLFYTSYHDVDDPKFSYVSSEVTVCEGVWLASGVVVLPGALIPKNSVVGAHSVCSGILVSDSSVYAGSPAKFVRTRLGQNFVEPLGYWW